MGLESRWRKRVRRVVVALAAGTSLLATACYPGSFGSADDLDLITTFFDTERDYGRDTRTYAMPDVVYDLSPEDEGGVPEEAEDYDDVILSTVAEQMSELGYRRIPADGAEEPDVVMLAGVVVADNWIIYYPGWGYYPPYWGPGWGYWYGYPIPVNYPTGSIILSMVRPDERDEEAQRVPVIWAAGTIGHVTGSGRTEERIENAIRQAFTQSEYLRVGDPTSPSDGGAP